MLGQGAIGQFAIGQVLDAVPGAGTRELNGWYNWLNEPVRIRPKGIKVNLQSTYTAPPRYLPRPNVFVTMAATEVNAEIAEFDVWAYTAPDELTDLSAVRASIVEVAGDGGAITSVIET